jgi:hypothetical protein
VLLHRVNGVARTLSSDFRPAGLTGRFSDEMGRQHQVVANASPGHGEPPGRWGDRGAVG